MIFNIQKLTVAVLIPVLLAVLAAAELPTLEPLDDAVLTEVTGHRSCHYKKLTARNFNLTTDCGSVIVTTEVDVYLRMSCIKTYVCDGPCLLQYRTSTLSLSFSLSDKPCMETIASGLECDENMCTGSVDLSYPYRCSCQWESSSGL